MYIAGDPTGSKVIAFSQIQDLGDHRTRRSFREVIRNTRSVAQAGLTVVFVAGSPFVEGFARKAEVAARPGNASGQIAGLPQELQTPGNHSIQFVLVHGLSPRSRIEPECHLSPGTSHKHLRPPRRAFSVKRLTNV
jgi:hypothetical protein